MEDRNCTPDELFVWRAGSKTVVHDTHALRTLTKQKNDIQITFRELQRSIREIVTTII